MCDRGRLGGSSDGTASWARRSRRFGRRDSIEDVLQGTRGGGLTDRGGNGDSRSVFLGGGSDDRLAAAGLERSDSRTREDIV